MASFPATVKAFTSHVSGDIIQPAHVNDLQDEVNAIETALVNGPIVPPNGNAGAPPYTFAGNVTTGMYSSGTNTLDFTTNGTKALEVDSTQFIDSPTQPRASAFHNTTQSVPTGAFTTLSLNSEDWDVGTLHDAVTNNSRLTVPTGAAGLYFIRASAIIANGASSTKYALQLMKNGVAIKQKVTPCANGAATGTADITDLEVLADADYIEVQAFQDSGGNANVGSASRQNSSELMMVKLW